jgi:rubrerythrin
MSRMDESVLKQAMEMELEGRRFYHQSLERARNPLVKRVFEALAREEDAHIDTIEKIFEEARQHRPLKEWVTTTGTKGELAALFDQVSIERVKLSKDELQALKVALGIEEKSMKYYETLASEAENHIEKRFYLTLSYEERGHYLHILDSIEYLSDPIGWYYVKEHDMVDGG